MAYSKKPNAKKSNKNSIYRKKKSPKAQINKNNKRVTLTATHKNGSTKGPVRKKQSNLEVIKNEDDSNFPLVAIGGSAGGLEGLEAFFAHLPVKEALNEKIAFIVITHLKEEHSSLLPELIQRVTLLKTVQIKEGMHIQPGYIYVISPSNYIAILKNKFVLLSRNSYKNNHLPINICFQSMAEQPNRKIVGVILSGAGSDGRLGVEAIHKANGLTLVQEPSTAKHTSMPDSAIETDCVDYIIPPSEMPKQLLSYLRSEIVVSHPNKEDENIKKLPPIFHLLRMRTRHDFSLYKPSTINRRIKKRMNLHQIDTIEGYVSYLRKHPTEIELLFQDLLINVTNFFRNNESFDKLKEVLNSLILTKPDGYCLRIWVPACSTGEEVYSIAILLRECMEEVNKDFKAQVFGTDVDESAIKIARNAIYSAKISHEMSSKRLKEFFIKEGKGYKVCKEIRQMVIFAKQNLIADPPFVKLDLLSCRNFLIYLTSGLQKKLIHLFHYSLKPEGILFIGSSENICNLTGLFRPINNKSKIFICQKNSDLIQLPIHMDNITKGNKIEVDDLVVKNKKIEELDIESLIEKTIIKDYNPTYALIDEKDNIVYVHDEQNRYFQTSVGFIKLNVLEMINPDLKEKLVLAMHRASSQQKKPVTYLNLPIKAGGKVLHVNLKVAPFREGVEKTNWKLIMIESCEFLEKNGPAQNKQASTKKLAQQISKLEQELKGSEENMQIVVEEMETTNEELKSSNEELQSANEELQSTNEELETSKEELQSLNEELTTVNSELEMRIEELSKANDDIQNLLYSTEIAVIFLDKELKVKRFTPKVTELISLILTDIGRPISDLVSTLNYDMFFDDIKQVLNTLTFKNVEVQSNKNQWYQVRIMPYRTVNNVVEGVVITFLDITAQKKFEEFVKQQEKLVSK